MLKKLPGSSIFSSWMTCTSVLAYLYKPSSLRHIGWSKSPNGLWFTLDMLTYSASFQTYTYPDECSKYGIFTSICPKNQPNVGKYTIHGANVGYKHTPDLLKRASHAMQLCWCSQASSYSSSKPSSGSPPRRWSCRVQIAESQPVNQDGCSV